MKGTLAGGLILAIALRGCQKKPQTTDDGLGAGATPPPPAMDTTGYRDSAGIRDTIRTPAIPDSSSRP